jgi:hypothetical protein
MAQSGESKRSSFLSGWSKIVPSSASSTTSSKPPPYSPPAGSSACIGAVRYAPMSAPQSYPPQPTPFTRSQPMISMPSFSQQHPQPYLPIRSTPFMHMAANRSSSNLASRDRSSSYAQPAQAPIPTSKRPTRRATDPDSYTDTRRHSETFNSFQTPAPPPVATSSTPSTSTSCHTDITFLSEKAQKLDDECKNLRNRNLSVEALAPARRAMYIRRLVYSLDDSIANTAALARSMTYVSRCLKDVDTLGSDMGEYLEILKETCQLYRVLCAHDEKYRPNLASSLYQLSMRHDDIGLKRKDTASLMAACHAAEESMKSFLILYRHHPTKYAVHLTNSYLNLSFISTDLGHLDRALHFAQLGVQQAYTLEDRMVLHKALLRLSNCYADVGYKADAKIAEEEARNVRPRQ